MALVTFNENVDHHVKGDVVELSKDELKAVDAYAEAHNIEKPYTKGEHQVSNTDDTPTTIDTARENSLASSDKEDAQDEENAPSEPVDEPAEESPEDETDEAEELPEATDEPAEDKPKAKK